MRFPTLDAAGAPRILYHCAARLHLLELAPPAADTPPPPDAAAAAADALARLAVHPPPPPPPQVPPPLALRRLGAARCDPLGELDVLEELEACDVHPAGHSLLLVSQLVGSAVRPV